MKKIQVCVGLLAIVCVNMLQGCGDVTLPTAPPACGSLAGAPKLNMQVVIREVKDERSMAPAMFYYHPDDLLHGGYDKTVAEIVREALVAEFRCVGITVTDNIHTGGLGALALECVIENFELSFSSGEHGQDFVEGTVTISFKWFDPASGAMVSVRRRTEKCTVMRKGLICYKDRFNFCDGEDHKAQVNIGNRMVQELLPKIIEKELTSNEYLKEKASSQP